MRIARPAETDITDKMRIGGAEGISDICFPSLPKMCIISDVIRGQSSQLKERKKFRLDLGNLERIIGEDIPTDMNVMTF